jgi:hypothetical protein
MKTPLPQTPPSWACSRSRGRAGGQQDRPSDQRMRLVAGKNPSFHGRCGSNGDPSVPGHGDRQQGWTKDGVFHRSLDSWEVRGTPKPLVGTPGNLPTRPPGSTEHSTNPESDFIKYPATGSVIGRTGATSRAGVPGYPAPPNPLANGLDGRPNNRENRGKEPRGSPGKSRSGESVSKWFGRSSE